VGQRGKELGARYCMHAMVSPKGGGRERGGR
jgi:hypothetical protein